MIFRKKNSFVVSKPSIFTFGFFSHLFLDRWYLIFFFPVWSLWIKAVFCTLWTDILFARYVGTTTTTFSILYSSSNTQKIALCPFWKAMVQSDNHLCQCYYINKKFTLGAKICPDIFLSFFLVLISLLFSMSLGKTFHQQTERHFTLYNSSKLTTVPSLCAHTHT